jgi:hypothetical protein
MKFIPTRDENPAWRDIIVNAVFNGLAILVVSLRMYSRRLTRAGFGWDDGFILIATALVNAMLIVTGFRKFLSSTKKSKIFITLNLALRAP